LSVCLLNERQSSYQSLKKKKGLGIFEMKFLTANKIALLGTAAQLYPSCRCCQQHLAMASTSTDDQIPDTADAAPQIITPTYSRDQRSSMPHGQEINLHIYLINISYGRPNQKIL
jgi:hypothetical protein